MNSRQRIQLNLNNTICANICFVTFYTTRKLATCNDSTPFATFPLYGFDANQLAHQATTSDHQPAATWQRHPAASQLSQRVHVCLSMNNVVCMRVCICEKHICKSICVTKSLRCSHQWMRLGVCALALVTKLTLCMQKLYSSCFAEERNEYKQTNSANKPVS